MQFFTKTDFTYLSLRLLTIRIQNFWMMYRGQPDPWSPQAWEGRETPKVCYGPRMRERTQTLPKAPKWPRSAVGFRKKSTICAITSPSLFHNNLIVRDSLLGKFPNKGNTGLVGVDVSAAHWVTIVQLLFHWLMLWWAFCQARGSIVIKGTFVDFCLKITQLAILNHIETQILYLNCHRKLRLLLLSYFGYWDVHHIFRPCCSLNTVFCFM